jgi:soluble P-type ATPase
MIEIVIPGEGIVRLENLVLDLNGTIALDGLIAPKVKATINALSQKLSIFILSSDIRGNLSKVTKGIKAEVIGLTGENSFKQKQNFLNCLDWAQTAVIGNGFNDHLILKEARIGIAVIGKEGASSKALFASDIIVTNIADALGLLMYPLRIVATLRR